jgi:LacI family transcriptional regulator
MICCAVYVIPRFRVGAWRVGLRAAWWLDQLMQGAEPPAEPVLLKPLGVAVRQSSDAHYVEDNDLGAALRYIREHLNERLTVQDLARHTATNRRRLERLFQKNLGRSPAREIERVRLEKAAALLAETEMPLLEIAGRTGYSCLPHLSRAFRQLYGVPPIQYRRQNRAGED